MTAELKARLKVVSGRVYESVCGNAFRSRSRVIPTPTKPLPITLALSLTVPMNTVFLLIFVLYNRTVNS
jgi:hypothetical protein